MRSNLTQFSEPAVIYLADHKLVFLKPRKTGGTSFEIALSKYASPEDIISPISVEDEKTRVDLGYRGAQNWAHDLSDIVTDPYRLKRLVLNWEWARKYYNHMPAAEVRDLIGAPAFDGALKVSMVRSPFEILVSKFFWSHRNKRRPVTFEDWIKTERALNFPMKNYVQYFIDGEEVVDHFVRHENLAADIATLEELRPELKGLADVFAGQRAKGAHRPKTARAAELFAGRTDLIDEVMSRYAWMIDKFGYQAP